MEVLTAGGLVFIILGWGGVGGLMIYCISKVMRSDKNVDS